MDFDYCINGITIEIDNQKAVEENNKKRMAAIFIKVREQTGMNRKDFAEWLGIPYRTMQDWERGVSRVPDYVLRLIAYKVKIEEQLKNGELSYINRRY